MIYSYYFYITIFWCRYPLINNNIVLVECPTPPCTTTRSPEAHTFPSTIPTLPIRFLLRPQCLPTTHSISSRLSPCTLPCRRHKIHPVPASINKSQYSAFPMMAPIVCTWTGCLTIRVSEKSAVLFDYLQIFSVPSPAFSVSGLSRRRHQQVESSICVLLIFRTCCSPPLP